VEVGLDDIDATERQTFWETWLRQYIELRLDFGIPIEDNEWRLVIRWSLRLASVLPELVALLGRHPAKQDKYDTLYYQLHEQEDFLQYPEAFADLLICLLTAEERLYHDCKYVLEIADKLLAANVSRPKLSSIAERLGELGCADAQEFAARLKADLQPT